MRTAIDAGDAPDRDWGAEFNEIIAGLAGDLFARKAWAQERLESDEVVTVIAFFRPDDLLKFMDAWQDFLQHGRNGCSEESAKLVRLVNRSLADITFQAGLDWVRSWPESEDSRVMKWKETEG